MKKNTTFLQILAILGILGCTTVRPPDDYEPISELSSSSAGEYDYCVYAEREFCIPGPFEFDACPGTGGWVSNKCPDIYQTVRRSSSSGSDIPCEDGIPCIDQVYYSGYCGYKIGDEISCQMMDEFTCLLFYGGYAVLSCEWDGVEDEK